MTSALLVWWIPPHEKIEGDGRATARSRTSPDRGTGKSQIKWDALSRISTMTGDSVVMMMVGET